MDIEQAQDIVFQLARDTTQRDSDDIDTAEQATQQWEAIEIFEKWAFDRLTV